MNWQILYRRGVLADRDPGKSLEMARQIIANPLATDQSVTWAHVLVCGVLRDQHKTEEAIGERQKAIKLDPHFALPHNNLGAILSDQHKTEEAITEYRKAIELDPREALAHNNLGLDLRDQRKTEEAIAEYKKAIELDPRYALPHRNLAIILRAEGKPRRRTPRTKRPKNLAQNTPIEISAILRHLPWCAWPVGRA